MDYYLIIIFQVLGLILPTISYPLWTYNVCGYFPTSYSETFRMWKKKIGFGFRFQCWDLFEILFILPGLYILSNTWYEYLLGFGSMFYLGLVALYPSGIDSDTTKLHCIFAKLCALSAILWLLFKEFYILVALLVIIGLIWSYLKKKYETFIMEFMAFIGVHIGITICCLDFIK